MNPASRYLNAPITEALLDIQVELPSGFVSLSLAQCQDFTLAEYPTKRELKAAFAHLELGDSVAATASSRDLGYAFRSADDKQVFQVRTNGFTANRLAPYTGWTVFYREARRLWDIYRRVAQPTKITRIALRYINRIDIPVSPVELDDYFRTAPKLSSDLPQSMTGLFMQVILPLEDIKSSLKLTETIIEPGRPDSVSVVLDIDLFRTENLPDNEDELWSLFEVLREKKNFVFEACITEKIRELIR